jgi:hypothetical protein
VLYLREEEGTRKRVESVPVLQFSAVFIILPVFINRVKKLQYVYNVD